MAGIFYLACFFLDLNWGFCEAKRTPVHEAIEAKKCLHFLANERI